MRAGHPVLIFLFSLNASDRCEDVMKAFILRRGLSNVCKCCVTVSDTNITSPDEMFLHDSWTQIGSLRSHRNEDFKQFSIHFFVFWNSRLKADKDAPFWTKGRKQWKHGLMKNNKITFFPFFRIGRVWSYLNYLALSIFQ